MITNLLSLQPSGVTALVAMEVMIAGIAVDLPAQNPREHPHQGSHVVVKG
jgi:hypothetical protein